VDNGQHVFMRCCESYLEFLTRIGVRERVAIQPRLAVPVASPDRRLAWIRRSDLPAPAHLARSLLGFHLLPLRDRLRATRSALAIGRVDPDSAEADARSLGEWLVARGESDAAIDGLWDLLVRATLNLSAREASLALAAKVLRTGFLERRDAADLGWPEWPLGRLHGDAGAAALRAAGVALHLRAPVAAIELRGARGAALRLRGERLAFDAVILATPHEAAARLAPAELPELSPSRVASLGRSPILNLHLLYDRRVLELPLLAGFGTPLQWIFDRTRSAGVDAGQYLAVSLSAAEPWIGRGTRELREIFAPALALLLPGARDARLVDFFVTCEPAATFRQAKGTRALRPGSRTRAAALHLAGAWTDTGWPATMEGAVRSGLAAARGALASVSAAGAQEAA
jgi:squalene-associated FAD-dependent desaturase